MRPRILPFLALLIAATFMPMPAAGATSALPESLLAAFTRAYDAHAFARAESLAAGGGLEPALARLARPARAILCENVVNACAYQGLAHAGDDVAYRYVRAAVALYEAAPVDSGALGGAVTLLARCLRDRLHPDSAQCEYRRAVAIESQLHGPGSWNTSTLLNAITKCQWMAGEFTEALATLDSAWAIRRALRPADDPDVCQIESNIAAISTELGGYARAKRLFEHVLAVYDSLAPHSAFYEQKVGEQSNNLGTVLLHMGDPRGASVRLRQSFELRRRTLGMHSEETSEVLDDLAQAELELGDTLAAAADWRQAYASALGRVPDDHRDLAEPLDRLGALALVEGQPDTARVDLELALGKRTRALGPAHPLVAETLRELAAVDRVSGRPDSARARLDRALAITRASLGTDHPDEGAIQLERAALERDEGRPDRALAEAIEAERIGSGSLRASVRALPEQEALVCARRSTSGLDLALTVLAESPRPPAEVAAAWNMLVGSRALVLDEMAARHRQLDADADSVSLALLARLTSARRRVAELAFAGPGDLPLERYRSMLAEARAAGDDAESRLALRAEPFAAARARAGTDLAGVRAARPAGAALVAYVRYHPWRRGALAASAGSCYLAFVQDARGGAPVAVPLGDAATTDAAIARWRDAVEACPPLPTPREARTLRAAGERVRERVWDPLAAATGPARMVLVVPDGAMQLVDLSVLPDPRDPSRYLVERRRPFHYLSAERDVAAVPLAAAESRALVMGDADFEHDPPALPDATGAVAGTYRGGTAACDDFASLRFEALSATGKEAREVAALIGPGVRARLGAEANEAEFKREAPRAAIVHVATHGFYLGDGCGSDRALPEAFAENPLLRSGIALAGANRRAHASGGEDGILTAEEIASLHLGGTSWVVLSACHSGVGEPVDGEGVLGLRRAVQIAGAHTLVLGLWRVGDDDSRSWMRALYSGRRLRHLDTAHAVMDASLERLAQCRRRGTAADPACWAPFIAAGDWR